MTIYHNEQIRLARDQAQLVKMIRERSGDSELDSAAAAILMILNEDLPEPERGFPGCVLPEPVAEVA